MRNAVAGVSLVLALAVAAPTWAQTIGATHVTNEPGATLLLPYFEAQVPKKIGGKASGIDTIFSINNASASSALVHVTIWTDLAVPVLGFNVYLTGYDIQPVDMVDILNGKLPVTADAGDDPTDTISHKGPVSQDINFPGTMAGQPAQLDDGTIAHIRAALTGKPSPLLAGQCAGRNLGEKKPIARGFVTVDSVFDHTALNPDDPAYFDIIDTRNILWGDYFFINKSKKIGRGDALVTVRASNSDPEVTGAGQYTFYQRIVDDGMGTGDRRQPLGSTFAARFVNVPKDPIYPNGTSALVWRDPKVNQKPFPCGTAPVWFPLGQEQLVVFDQQENPELSFATPFPVAAQIVKIGGPFLPVTPQAGWIFMNLNTFAQGAAFTPLEDITADQAFVATVFDFAGKYSVAARAIVLDDAADAQHLQLPLP